MKDSIIYYSVGALLYCPANSTSIASSIINQKFGRNYSLALCLEDTIQDNRVQDAENQLISSLEQIRSSHSQSPFYLPKIFIRVRTPDQMSAMFVRLASCMNLVTGFIAPKFSPENADSYINAITGINEAAGRPVYFMPIYESASIVDLRHRYDILYQLKEKLDRIGPLVLNIRVGGNDLCHLFGFRRHSSESIHQITPVANIFADIITVYGADYVISGPVWEYYDGTGWKEGLENELAGDRLCGFIGKTVIHPNQIDVVNAALKVTEEDLADAKSILGWDPTSNSLVSGSAKKERMNEYKTHSNWALRTVMLADAYGTRNA